MEIKWQTLLTGPGSKALFTAASAMMIWGAMISGIYSSSNTVVYTIAGVCAFFGWKSLNRIQPAMFIWMSGAGWLAYFFIKSLLAIVIGFFVAPITISKKIGEAFSRVR